MGIKSSEALLSDFQKNTGLSAILSEQLQTLNKVVCQNSSDPSEWVNQALITANWRNPEFQDFEVNINTRAHFLEKNCLLDHIQIINTKFQRRQECADRQEFQHYYRSQSHHEHNQAHKQSLDLPEAH